MYVPLKKKFAKFKTDPNFKLCPSTSFQQPFSLRFCSLALPPALLPTCALASLALLCSLMLSSLSLSCALSLLLPFVSRLSCSLASHHALPLTLSRSLAPLVLCCLSHARLPLLCSLAFLVLSHLSCHAALMLSHCSRCSSLASLVSSRLFHALLPLVLSRVSRALSSCLSCSLASLVLSHLSRSHSSSLSPSCPPALSRTRSLTLCCSHSCALG